MSNNIDFRKQVFLSAEKVSECSPFVNKYVMQSLAPTLVCLFIEKW